MNLAINDKNIDIGEALSGRVEESLNAAVTKYFDNALEGTVTFLREAHLFWVDISVHARRGMVMQGSAIHDDAYAAFYGALTRISKQQRRYTRRLDGRHKGSGAEMLAAQQYILAAESVDAEGAADDNPTIVAEMPSEIDTLTGGEAVMRMDLADTPAMMFRNSAYRRLSVLYRRPDGNIGWIDPEAH
jgi:ribosomal subunit interface protein